MVSLFSVVANVQRGGVGELINIEVTLHFETG